MPFIFKSRFIIFMKFSYKNSRNKNYFYLNMGQGNSIFDDFKFFETEKEKEYKRKKHLMELKKRQNSTINSKIDLEQSESKK